MKFLLGILVFVLILFSNANAFFKKDVKAFLCNFKEGIYNNPDLGKTGDPCMEGSVSRYKFYIGGKFKAKEEDECMEFIQEYADTPEMLKEYPIDSWMIGCDNKW